MVTLPPEALRVTGRVCVVPTVTLPKLSGAGAIANWPGVGAAAVPIPARGMAAASGPERTGRPPFKPVAAGQKVTLNVHLGPEVRLNGNQDWFMRTHCRLPGPR